MFCVIFSDPDESSSTRVHASVRRHLHPTPICSISSRGFAHEELGDDTIALRLLLHAQDRAPQQVDILADLAEIYFAVGRHSDFVRTATQVDRLPATPDERGIDRLVRVLRT
jgi:hypothetical protein